MPHVSRLIGLAVLVLVALSLVIVALEAQQPPRSLLLAYGNVSAIGAEGGNVTRLVATLNEAINLTEAGQYDGAAGLASSILNRAPALARQVEQGRLLEAVAYGALGALAVSALTLLYLRRRELVGSLWLRFRGGDRATLGGGKARGFLTDSEVLAVLTGLAIVLAVFLAAHSLTGVEATQFSAIGLLGPGGKIGGYPTSVAVNQTINTYILVYNHMNRPIWFVVYIYVTNDTTPPPLPGNPLLTYQRVLLSNETWVAPLSLRLNETGDFRLVGELWMYDPLNLTLTYTGEYVQLWVNATGG